MLLPEAGGSIFSREGVPSGQINMVPVPRWREWLGGTSSKAKGVVGVAWLRPGGASW